MPGTGAAWKYAYYPLPLPVANFSAKVIHMGKLIQQAYAALDAAIAKDGEYELMFKVCDLTAEGESIESVGRAVGVRAPVLKKWIKGEKWRLDDYEDAKKDFASRLIYEGLASARDATPEDVAVRRLQVDAYHKTAAKMSREEWGEQKQLSVIEGMTMDQALGGFASMLLEKMQVVSVQPVAQHESPTGEVVENEVEKFSAQKFLTGEIDAE